ncbi:MAG: lipopolysaccharide heptosyltransferase family protein [Calditrichaeota bacterium]|nr:MAG: lipopolysaccharide heptosyltransferase family protein [Calditrichota bacterium]MBL1204601.1 lipopolysaccharide heptosyltransferase family protein [Calditrichota bacterium]NOG44430.1 glycosyltransferase family 9 protein [Calditrichota bacterium]
MALKSILVSIRDLLLYFSDSVFKLFSTKSLKESNQIAIVRMDAIGDFLLWHGFASAIRKHYSESRITFICNKVVYDLVKTFPYFDTIIPINVKDFRNKLKYRYSVLKSLQNNQFEILLNPLYNRRENFIDAESVVRLLKAKSKIGYNGERPQSHYKFISDKWYSQLIDSDNKQLMELERNSEFNAAIGIPDIKPDQLLIPIQLIPDYKIESDNYYILFPGAGSTIRQWPVDKFAQIATEIYLKYKLTVVICGGPGDKDLAKHLTNQLDVPFIDKTGQTSLPEFMGIIKKSRFLIGNETSAVHMAALLKVPSVCLLGGGHYKRFIPFVWQGKELNFSPHPVIHKMDCFNCNWKCIYNLQNNPVAPCISKIASELVLKSISEFYINPNNEK